MGFPWITGPGYPMEATSYFQSLAELFTQLHIIWAVIFGPDGVFRSVLCPGRKDLHVSSTDINHQHSLRNGHAPSVVSLNEFILLRSLFALVAAYSRYGTGLCHPPTSAVRRSASGGPQVAGL